MDFYNKKFAMKQINPNIEKAQNPKDLLVPLKIGWITATGKNTLPNPPIDPTKLATIAIVKVDTSESHLNTPAFKVPVPNPKNAIPIIIWTEIDDPTMYPIIPEPIIIAITPA